MVVVANKYQTGFDEPKLQTMYLNKPIKGVQSVQTLSRLNRTTKGKTHTFVLDFVNEPESIIEAFQRFYTSTQLEKETDPNQMYDNLTQLKNYQIILEEEINEFNTIFFDPKRTEGQLHPTLDKVVDRFIELEEDEQDMFKSYLLTYIKAYSYLSQILTFKDPDLEKYAIFLKYLYKKLPKQAQERFELDSSVELKELRVNKIRDIQAHLVDEESILNSLLFVPKQPGEEAVDLLSEIINQVNHLYGIELSEDDLGDVKAIENILLENNDLKEVMTSNNSEQNKMSFLKNKFELALLDLVDKNIEMFNTLRDNQPAKNMIFQAIYRNYLNDLETA